jgi:hypothetical protein
MQINKYKFNIFFLKNIANNGEERKKRANQYKKIDKSSINLNDYMFYFCMYDKLGVCVRIQMVAI